LKCSDSHIISDVLLDHYSKEQERLPFITRHS
jgi:hypothetical protein